MCDPNVIKYYFLTRDSLVKQIFLLKGKNGKKSEKWWAEKTYRPWLDRTKFADEKKLWETRETSSCWWEEKFRNSFKPLKIARHHSLFANTMTRKFLFKETYLWWTLYTHESGRDLLISQQLYVAGKFDIRYGVSSPACSTMYSRCKSGVLFK